MLFDKLHVVKFCLTPLVLYFSKSLLLVIICSRQC